MFKEGSRMESAPEVALEARPPSKVTRYVLVQYDCYENEAKIMPRRLISSLYHWTDNEKAVDITEKLSPQQAKELMGE
jgi:hypothetical protein